MDIALSLEHPASEFMEKEVTLRVKEREKGNGLLFVRIKTAVPLCVCQA